MAECGVVPRPTTPTAPCLHQATFNSLPIRAVACTCDIGAEMTSKVYVNGNSSGHDPQLQTAVTTALLQNGGVARIQHAFRQRLDEAGWAQALREYTERLFRSGEATTYEDALSKVMAAIRHGGGHANGSVNGSGAGVPDLSVPTSAKEGGAEAVRRELEGICDLKK